MDKALVTGCAGFLGSHLSDKLLESGFKVIGIDNFFRGKKDYLPENPNFSFHKLDLTNSEEELIKLLKKENPDIVVHYAAINGTKYFYDFPEKVLNSNTEMNRNLISALKKSKIDLNKFVYASSSEVYGESPLTIPTPEEHPVILNPHTKRDSYAASKAIGEFQVKYFCENSDVKFLIFRIFNVYGPRMDTSEYGQVVPEFIRKAFEGGEFEIIGDGKQTRAFCYVADHVDLALQLIKKASNEIINVGNNKETKIYDLAKKICELSNQSFKPNFLEPREHDPERRSPDLTKLREYTNLPKDNLEEGLKKSIDWYSKRWKFGAD